MQSRPSLHRLRRAGQFATHAATASVKHPGPGVGRVGIHAAIVDPPRAVLVRLLEMHLRHVVPLEHGRSDVMLRSPSTLVALEALATWGYVGREDGATLHLSAHLARANPQCKTLTDQTALVIFAEPHAYVSPSHYDRPLNVPTWNYIAVHAYGRATLLPDLAASLAALEAMIDHFEPSYRSQWEGLPDDYKHKMAAGIVAFEIAVEELQGKEKLSQNKTEAARLLGVSFRTLRYRFAKLGLGKLED